MMQWLLKHTRTRPDPVPSGRLCAMQTVAAVQLGLQLLLWITFGGYDRAVQAVWQSALMLLVPLMLLWLGWRMAQPALDRPAARWLMLLLLPCLWLDAAFLFYALCGLMDLIIPEYAWYVGGLAAAAICYLTVLSAREDGVAYGTSALRYPLVLLFLLGTVLLRSSRRADRLWPIWGQGLANTAMTALRGSGSLWSTALLFVLPGKEAPKPRLRSVGWAFVPWLTAAIWALWCGFMRPWSPGDALSAGQRLMGLARHATGVVNYQLAGLLWLAAIPTALCGNALSGELLLRRAMPKLPRLLATAAVLLPALLVVLWIPERLPSLLSALLPWRIVPCILTLPVLGLMARKEAA